VLTHALAAGLHMQQTRATSTGIPLGLGEASGETAAFGDWLGKFWEKIKTPFKAVGGLWDKMWGKKDAPELSIPEMQPVGDALKTPLSVTPKTVENKTQNNSYSFNTARIISI
jgi:hypothetical protein